VQSGPIPAAHAERVSIVLATYNGARFLAEQLTSLRDQIRPPDEVVIVDDDSTDATPELLQEFALSAPFPVILELRREHLGTWMTFEEGLRRATGDMIVICDQDDRWRADKVAVLTRRLADEPGAMMAFSDARLISVDGDIIDRSRWRIAGFSPRRSAAVTGDPLGTLLPRQAVSGCTMAIRAELIPLLLPFPTGVHPGLPTMMYDRWISLAAAAVGSVVSVPDQLVDYRIHPNQQIGIPALRLRKVAPRLALHAAQFVHGRTETKHRIDYHLAHLQEIEKRLDATSMASQASDRRLEDAQRHLRLRSELAVRRRDRLGPVTQELRNSDGYRRFSLGLVSALSDAAR
jgi:glycosyltransferase involved in cell wall biosynthesis